MQPPARFIELALGGCCLGIMMAAGLTALPSDTVLTAAGIVGCLLMWWPWGRWLACLLMGFAWAGHLLGDELDHQVEACIAGGDVRLQGTIAGLPEVSAGRLQFYLDLKETTLGSCPGVLTGRVRMSWFDAPVAVSAGEQWSFDARLKPIHGHVNPGGFDYERWALSRHLRGAGYVKSGQRLSAAAGPGANEVRAALRRELAGARLQHPGILLALATGDTSLISKQDWETFRATGTVHLVVISGLHLGLVAGFGWWIGRLTPLSGAGLARRWPRQWMGFATAVTAAAGYGTLAGWTLPVSRAWLMVAVSLAWVAAGRRLSLSYLYVLVMTGVLLIDPLAALDTGFWLSFGAVGILLAAFGPRFGRIRGHAWGARAVGWGRDLVWAQLVLFAAMAAMLAATIGQIPLIAPLVNLVAVPLVSLVLVPLVLMATLAGEAMLGLAVAGNILTFADQVAGGLVWWLEGAARQAPVLSSGIRSISAAMLTGLASVLVLMPIALAWRALALVVVLSSFPARESPVAQGEFRVMALDVGQGLSVVVDTARHRLVYDAGPRYRSGFDLGATVVAPALRATGRDNVELFIVSHADNDHAGGERAVRDLVSVRAVLRGSPDAALGGARCEAGNHWQWDGVRFDLLHPAAALAERRNDQSCVLLITNRTHAVLLPGDISAAVERRLTSIGAVGKLTLLVAPHHGSRTSSSGGFLATTSPRFAWFSAGYLNRFGHPDAEVVARYDRIGTRIETTADAGALRWASDRPGQVDGWRRLSPRFWR